MSYRPAVYALATVCLATWAGFARAEQPHETAAKIDASLAKEFPAWSQTGPAAVDDATFLRRVSLDITGESPSPEELTAFLLSPANTKRRHVVDRLLADPHYGQNWARYWRDVIMTRRSDERAQLVNGSLTKYMTEQLNAGAKWDEIARDFITATGDALQNGACAIVVAQMGETADVTAEVSRIFMGVQIQCAQCHNHPTDRWKREQFHELAAFFPRVVSRLQLTPERRTIEVSSMDRVPFFRGPMMRKFNTEHYMPDLKHPEEQGTLMQPVLFSTGQKLDAGLTDKERRSALADWLTAKDNRWFAKAMVNRMWSELVGQGFSEPVDDLGPDRKSVAPQTFELLATEFAASNYDLKWLIRTITATAAYQRQSRSRDSEAAVPFAANCPQPLRADQLFNQICSALGIVDNSPADAGYFAARFGNAGPRAMVVQTFGYDPSVRRDEVGGSIPQALFMMNSPVINQPINGRYPQSTLGKLLADVKDNEAVVVELYLRTLSREPKDSELQSCLRHVGQTKDRSEAFEDIFWALMNSTEFLHRK